MIVVTGGRGFIGGALVRKLERLGQHVVIFDLRHGGSIHPTMFQKWWDVHNDEVEFVIHLGAITDTTCQNKEAFDTFNLNFSKAVFLSCAADCKPLIYASSAATYGDGDLGFKDSHSLIPTLQPKNLYAHSKNDFDKFVLAHQRVCPPFWAGLKFFNVYGWDESHKGPMSSMAFQIYWQILKTGKVKLFEGLYSRDFVYVDDVVDIILWMMDNKPISAIYNIGTGRDRTFEELTEAVSTALGIPTSIEYIPMPEHLKDAYQKLTRAELSKLRGEGWKKPFIQIEEGCSKYVKLLNEDYNISVEPTLTERQAQP